jgi:hypothetical protein
MVIEAGGIMRAAEWVIHDWEPTFDAGITTLGVGTTPLGWYTQRAGIVEGHFYIAFAGSPVFASTISMFLPVVGDFDGIQAAAGSWVFRDNSAGEHYAGTLGVWSGDGDSVSFSGCWDGTAPRSRITNGKPFTVAAGDILSGSFKYRSA